MFMQLATQAGKQTNINTIERVAHLSFLAQGQSRTTVAGIAFVKNPTDPVFARQANIAHGPQQVNNGVVGDIPARSRKGFRANQTVGGRCRPERLDVGAAGAATARDSALAPVGALYRTEEVAG